MTLELHELGSGTDIASVVRLGSMGIASSADGGGAVGSVIVDDPAGTRTLVGWQFAYVDETACTDAPRLWTGYLGRRRYRRGPYRDGTAREIEVELFDANSLFDFHVILEDGKRPQETFQDRLDWIMESAYMYGIPQTWVDLSTSVRTATVDESDYRGQHPSNVLADLAGMFDCIYFVKWDQDNDELGLFLDTPSVTTETSVLKLSSDMDDVDDDEVFYPFLDGELERDPTEVYSLSRLVGPFPGGVLVSERTATADAFRDLGINNETTRIRSLATATAWNTRFLVKHSTEWDTVTCSVLLPKTHVGLIDAGQKLYVKFLHLINEGYGTDFVGLRVQHREVRHAPESIERPDLYLMHLTLSSRARGIGGVGGGGGGSTPPPDILPHPQPPPGGGDTCWTIVTDATGVGEDIDDVAELQYQFSATTNVIVKPTWNLETSDTFGWLLLKILYNWDNPTPTSLSEFHIFGRLVSDGSPNDNLCWNGGPDSYCSTAAIVGAALTQPTNTLVFPVGPPATKTLRIWGLRSEYETTGTPWSGSVGTACIESVTDDVGNPLTNEVAITNDNDDTAPQTGSWVLDETPPTITPTGGVTNIVTKWPYATGSLRVKVDGVLISSTSVVEDDPAAGTFHLIWQIDSDETVIVSYQGI